MTSMYAPIARILLRYASTAAFSAGYLSPEMVEQIGADPDLVMLISGGLAALVEAGYFVAKRTGGVT